MLSKPETGKTHFPPEPVIKRDQDGVSTILHLDNGFYCLGPENQVLVTVTDGILQETPSFPFRPLLFFYGPSGCGKSHFLIGIHHAWQSKHKKNSSLYMTGEEFARSFATAIASKTTDDFRRKFLSASLIIMDDAHLLQGKNAAQSELLVLLDFAQTRKQVVLFASPQIPSRTVFFDDRLIARLVAGLILPVSLPGQAARQRIVRNLAQKTGISLPSGMIQEIAKQLSGPVPRLEGFLAKLMMELGEHPSSSDVRKHLKQFETDHVPTVDRISKVVAKRMGLKLGDMKSKSRKSSVVQARGIAMYLARQTTGLSLREIGRYFGNRDHTTVAHQVTQVEKNMADGFQWRDTVLKIREIIQAESDPMQ